MIAEVAPHVWYVYNILLLFCLKVSLNLTRHKLIRHDTVRITEKTITRSLEPHPVILFLVVAVVHAL